MIRVTVLKEKDKTKAIRCSGHAGFDSYGKDIVCSSVSVLVINTLNSIEVLTDDSMQTSTKEEDGIINADFPKGLSHDAEVLISSMVLGLQQIQDTYGKRYLEFQIQEVTQC